MNEELLSVIVLTYKHGELLKETLNSIFKQTYKNIEIIIAEDGAQDFDKEIIEKYIEENKMDNIINVVMLVNHQNKGTVKNLNNAIKKASGKYIKIIAGDDIYPSNDVFEKQIIELENSGKKLIIGNIVECDSKMNPICSKGFEPSGLLGLLNANKETLRKYIVCIDSTLIATQCICFSRDFFENYGYYDERLKLIEDLPMAMNIISSDSYDYQNIDSVNHRGNVGVSATNKMFDKRKINYYEDLEIYFKDVLRPWKDELGESYLNMRSKICRFRINYSLLGEKQLLSKAFLLATNLKDLLYYFYCKKQMRMYITKNYREDKGL